MHDDPTRTTPAGLAKYARDLLACVPASRSLLPFRSCIAELGSPISRCRSTGNIVSRSRHSVLNNRPDWSLSSNTRARVFAICRSRSQKTDPRQSPIRIKALGSTCERSAPCPWRPTAPQKTVGTLSCPSGPACGAGQILWLPAVQAPTPYGSGQRRISQLNCSFRRF